MATFQEYIELLRKPHLNISRMEFLDETGAVAFALDNNPKNSRSKAFIQGGSLTVNLENGVRRRASVTFGNADKLYDFAINKIWFGQQVRLLEGVQFPNGEEYLLPQGVFYLQSPNVVENPVDNTVTYQLVDKWAYLDGTLHGNLEGIYYIPRDSNIYQAIMSILALPRGVNGIPVDRVQPVFTYYYYTAPSITLPDGTTMSMLNTPYEYYCESDNGTYAEIILELNKMLVGWVGYDRTGALRIDAGAEDINDAIKPIVWDFTPRKSDYLGSTYDVKDTETYNHIVVIGEALTDYGTPKGEAEDTTLSSVTNIYGTIARKTKRIADANYYTDEQCEALAKWYLKRYTTVAKSITIQSPPIYHLNENEIVTIENPDTGERMKYLVTGYSRPIASVGSMTINATSVRDLGGV